MNNYAIYLSRLVSAFCLFLLLAQANVWLNTVDNTILVLGYRLFILVTPFFFLFFRHRLTFYAFLIAELGLLLWLLHTPFLAAVLVALGLAVSGYMLKYYSAFTTQGAASNKIAINIGSILSGVAIIFTRNQYLLLLLCMLFIIFSMLAFYHYAKQNQLDTFQSHPKHFSFKGCWSKRGIAWAIVGYVTGVKLIAILSILPQALIRQNAGILPYWYGVILIVNCLIVVCLQLPIMKWIARLGKKQAIIPLFVGMLIIMLAQFFAITTFLGALLWISALSLVECAISYLDKLSQDDHLLLLKDSAVGIGSAVTVYAIRETSPAFGTVLIGASSMLLLVISLLLFWSDCKGTTEEA